MKLVHARVICQRAPGQVVVLFALTVTALIGFAALAIDVSSAYSQERFQKTVADAAALAGAQDLFQPDSRAVPPNGPANARTNAMALLVLELGATSTPGCYQNCQLPGTPYTVWITTPSPTCVNCDPDRSVQVTIRRPGFQLTFGRLFGQSNWQISTTSVAGLTSAIRYALVTLRVPDIRGNTDANGDDVNANGQSTVVRILNGDIATNTNVEDQLSPPCVVQLDAGFHIYHYDLGEPWCKDAVTGQPKGVLTQVFVNDPNYVTTDQFAAIRDWLLANQLWTGQNVGEGATPGEDPGCANASTYAPGSTVPALIGYTTRCYRPGFYPTIGSGAGASAFKVQNNEWAYLYPGVYFFDGDVTITAGGQITGGNLSNSAGVALLMRNDKAFKNNGMSISLNMGTDGCVQDSCRALPASGPFGALAGPRNVPLTLIVEKYPGCFGGPNGTVPQLCTDTNNDTKNKTLNLQGGADLNIAGIIYAPSDRVQVASNNGTQTGTLGQIIAWQVTYTGNTSLNQSFPGLFDEGVLRIDSACSKGSPPTPCNAP